MTTIASSLRTPTVPNGIWLRTLRPVLVLAGREMRTALRTPAYLVPNMIVPIFFYFVMVGTLETFAGRSGLDNWEAFMVRMAIIFTVQGGSAGLNLVSDIESGYFDKLLETPANRFSILVGAMAADFLRVMPEATLVLLVAIAVGFDFATGLPGAAALVLLSSFWGLAYSGIGFAVALKTGSAQATQSMWVLMFLTTMFAPKESLSGWLETAATLNPMTYLLQGMRALSMQGWSASDIGAALLAAGALGAVSLSLAFFTLRGRLR